jgi:hypothetical protein
MRSGREMFEFNPDLFRDEEDVLDADELEPELEEEDQGPIRTIDVTETSIKTTVTNSIEENGKEIVDETLFNEEEIPEEDE